MLTQFARELKINEASFWAKVDRSGGEFACWPWTAASTDGYGAFRVGLSRNSMIRAHRVAFGLKNGFLPLVVRHSCDNPPCCNPAHLLGGTRAENNHDMISRGRAFWQRGTGNPAVGVRVAGAKLKDKDIPAIRRKYATGKITQRQLAREYAVCQRTIARITQGVGWKHV